MSEYIFRLGDPSKNQSAIQRHMFPPLNVSSHLSVYVFTFGLKVLRRHFAYFSSDLKPFYLKRSQP